MDRQCSIVYLVLALLHVLVRASSANPPIIHYSHNMRILKIPFNTEPGSVVYRIKATDADNQTVIFDVLEDYGKDVLRFDKVHHNEANVVLVSPLKESDEFNLTIYATDNQESTYIESRLIATSVPNVDNFTTSSPIQLQHNPVYVFENETLNKSITVVRALDQEDSKLPVMFELLDNSDLFDFHYVFGPRGTSTAELLLIGELDFERQNLYTLTLLAINAQTDKQVDTRNVHSVQLSIVVRDIQDNPPVFRNLPQTLSLDKFNSNGIIYNVSAQDGDTVNRRNVTFSIKSPKSEYFKIANNGSVSLTIAYDSLVTLYPPSQPIQLEIQATEIVINELVAGEPISSVSQLILCLTYENQAPNFKVDHLVGRVNEHSHIQSAVTWQSAHLAHVMDLDAGLNATIDLELIDPTGTFIIKPSSAYRETYFTLLVNDSTLLDFQANNLSVMIIAKDQSRETPLTTNITCTIFIDDVNDNYPQFSERMYQSAIYENAQAGTSITQIIATDKDTGDYGQVRFTAIKGIFALNLHIDATSGVVTLANNSVLDREFMAEYVVSIEARDDQGNGNLNTTELHIKVLDLNDNPPIFLQSSYIALVNNDLSDFLLPLQLTAIDIDEINTANSMVNYEILHGNYEDYFQIDNQSGRISINPMRDKPKKVRNGETRIELTVRSYDLGVPQMSSTTKVHIFIMNRPNHMRALFITRKKLNFLQGNQSLERYLGDITGGSVTIAELKRGKKESEPSSIIASVKYPNESTIDLDAIPGLFDHLVENGKHEREIEMVPTKSSGQQNANIANQENHDIFTGRVVRTSQLGNFDIILWIMIFLILLLLFILLYLLCLLCRDRRHGSKTAITQTELPIKNNWSTGTGKAKRRKIRQIRNTNKVVSLAEDKDKAMVVALDKAKDQQTEYEVQEGSYANSPNTVTYYHYKRLSYPTKQGTTPDIVDQVSDFPEDHSPRRVEQGRSIGQLEHNLVNTQEAFTNERTVTFAEATSKETDTTQIEKFNASTVQDLAGSDLEDMSNNYKNIHRRSIFTITYDKIHNRENISAGSDKTN